MRRWTLEIALNSALFIANQRSMVHLVNYRWANLIKASATHLMGGKNWLKWTGHMKQFNRKIIANKASSYYLWGRFDKGKKTMQTKRILFHIGIQTFFRSFLCSFRILFTSLHTLFAILIETKSLWAHWYRLNILFYKRRWPISAMKSQNINSYGISLNRSYICST